MQIRISNLIFFSFWDIKRAESTMDKIEETMPFLNDNKSLQMDLSLLHDIASSFKSIDHSSEDATLMRHLGNELEIFSARVRGKLKYVQTKILEMREKTTNIQMQTDMDDLVASISADHDVSNTDANLSPHVMGFMDISSQSMQERIGISCNGISPVICLWQACVDKAQGKIQTAIRMFFQQIETYHNEISNEVMKIASVTYRDGYNKCDSKKLLAKLANYQGPLSEYNDENLNVAEVMIALTSYILGDNTIYTSLKPVKEIQKRHTAYIKYRFRVV